MKQSKHEEYAKDECDYQQWIESCAKECKCCPICCTVPCDSVMSGGLCDEECHCDSDNDYDEDEL